ncbi:mitochondrial MICOS protein Mic60 (mitofilin) [Andalucia godoyi]|uniref:Mitochondrial MICOS protein Mic60 (Mitofilin) n=1 Tax=Andalucia godoyi TaxID=505711 RepID=A0A8K0AHE0_ANDGO|nr:mitochondrial MICOS protein Mic60 (mitofilin) [Andalucia godoyi]|eukprot:ANDGO_05965.mRNA.1 mitochondrial MICOS protein Mic60 (mitofilin)
MYGNRLALPARKSLAKAVSRLSFATIPSELVSKQPAHSQNPSSVSSTSKGSENNASNSSSNMSGNNNNSNSNSNNSSNNRNNSGNKKESGSVGKWLLLASLTPVAAVALKMQTDPTFEKQVREYVKDKFGVTLPFSNSVKPPIGELELEQARKVRDELAEHAQELEQKKIQVQMQHAEAEQVALENEKAAIQELEREIQKDEDAVSALAMKSEEIKTLIEHVAEDLRKESLNRLNEVADSHADADASQQDASSGTDNTGSASESRKEVRDQHLLFMSGQQDTSDEPVAVSDEDSDDNASSSSFALSSGANPDFSDSLPHLTNAVLVPTNDGVRKSEVGQDARETVDTTGPIVENVANADRASDTATQSSSVPAEVEDTRIKLTQEELDALVANKVKEAVETVEQQMTESTDFKLREQADRLVSQYANKLHSLEASLTMKYNDERDSRLSELAHLRDRASHAFSVVDALNVFRAEASAFHVLEQSCVSLIRQLESNAPFAKELSIVKSAASQVRPFLSDVLSTLDGVSKNGIPTVGELASRFEASVYPEARRACFIPYHSGLFGFVYGSIASSLISDKVQPRADDASGYANLWKAREHLRKGHLLAAVEQVRNVQGLPGKLARDWLKQAMARIAAEQAADVLRAEIVLYATSFEESDV